MRLTLFALLLATTAHAQWTLLDSHSTADFRGVASVGKGIVWVSGTNGTVLRSEDAGYLWQHCTTPPGAEKLDFRGIQAFDANTAIVMSSGKGDLSRLYKTTDGCQTWKLLFTNPDGKDGFFDALQLSPASGLIGGYLAGDPVNGKFPLWFIVPDYKSPANAKEMLIAHSDEAAFAASNTSLFIYSQNFWLATGGKGGARVIRKVIHGGDEIGWVSYPSSDVPVGQHTESSGIFSLDFNVIESKHSYSVKRGIAVGGDYLKPNDSTNTAAFSTDGGKSWTASTTSPHGYRSAVAYDASTKTWITVGPNGTDISTDDGRNWRALKPGPNDPPIADQHWNALSLPFVVGPHGRIGVLNPAALKAPAK